MTKQMKLGAFFNVPGHHFASWRIPSTEPERTLDLDYFTELAQIAERGKFDTIFFADGLGAQPDEYTVSGIKLDPIMIQASLSAVTKHIGLVATLTTSYNEPFQIARKYMSLDHLSKGRAAWNVVTSMLESEAQLFGKETHIKHANRYERAEEFVDIVKQFWLSIDRDALVINKETGQYLDVTKTNEVNYEGKHLKAKGFLDVPTSRQGHPVVVQAGSSDAGKELAARTAEVIFTAAQTLEDAQAFYKDVKDRLAKYGRDKDDLKIMPGVFITVAETEAEAIVKRKKWNSYIHPQAGLNYLSTYLGTDLSGYNVDGPIPNKIDTEDKTNPNTRANLVRSIVQRENLQTIRELYEFIAGARGHREIVGTPAQIADQLQEWFENEAADGFNVMAPTFPEGLTDIVELVIPELQRRGIFRTEYEGTTLRENLGLKNPVLELQRV